MLWVPRANQFAASVSNYSTYTEAGFGTSLTAGGTNHVKNSTITSILSALAYDCYWVTIAFCNGFSSTASRRFLTDIYIDPAGGTTWSNTPLIANLAANSCSLTQGGVWYSFPVFIPAGASIGATCQAETASATVRIGVKCAMKPSNLEVWPYGTKVITYGATTGTTVGTAMTPGSSGAKGSYSASLATVAHDLMWLQAGMLINDASQTAVQYFMDVAFGDANSKYDVMCDLMHLNIGTTEVGGRPSNMGACLPYVNSLNGQNLYIRSACTGTPDSNVSGIVYGVAK